MKIIIYCCIYLCCLFNTNGLYGTEIPSSSNTYQITNTINSISNQPTCSQELLSKNQGPKRVSFPNRTGFVLLRKNEIVYASIDLKRGGTQLHYRQRGQDKNKLCTLNLAKVGKRLNGFPFIKVSRSTIVNFHEIDAYIGTRRDAKLIMSNGDEVNVSRSRAGVLHDFIKEMDG